MLSAGGSFLMYHLTINVPTKDLTLYPICDVQVGAHGFAEKDYSEYVREAAEDPIGLAFGGGDYLDGVSPSNRRLLMSSFVRGDLYDTVKDMLKAGSDEQKDLFLHLTSPLKKKMKFMLKGHHLHEYVRVAADGTHQLRTTDHDIAEELGAKYLGEPGNEIGSAMITFRFPAVNGERPQLRMYARHGQGASSTFSSPLTALEKQMRAHTADIYFVAHHHKLAAARAVKLSEDNSEDKLKATDGLLVSGGSWLKGYLINEVTYAEDGQMVPLAVGAPIIRIKRRDDGTFKIRTEI